MNKMQRKECEKTTFSVTNFSRGVSEFISELKPLRASRLIIYLMIAGCSLGAVGCKSSKKAANAKAMEEARLAKEAKDREEKAKREEAERLKKEAEAKRAPYQKVENVFSGIAGASSLEDANAKISEALGMFSTPDAPLLISISKEGDQKDYDKPTTIKKYLEYLKDQKKNLNTVDNLVFDENGKIKEIELRKK